MNGEKNEVKISMQGPVTVMGPAHLGKKEIEGFDLFHEFISSINRLYGSCIHVKFIYSRFPNCGAWPSAGRHEEISRRL